MEEPYVETTGTLAKKSLVLPETIRAYANAGLLPCKRLENGVRLFPASAVARVREILAERLARRGGRHEAVKVA